MNRAKLLLRSKRALVDMLLETLKTSDANVRVWVDKLVQLDPGKLYYLKVDDSSHVQPAISIISNLCKELAYPPKIVVSQCEITELDKDNLKKLLEKSR